MTLIKNSSLGYPRIGVNREWKKTLEAFWAADIDAKLAVLKLITEHAPASHLWILPSSSLLHVPVTTKLETKLESVLKQGLAFANEKLDELTLLTKAFLQGTAAISAELEVNRKALQELNASPSRCRF
jgi:5-methyltetrahydropteroyltriglutamate--homocysteine methyltransferase